MSGEDPSNGWLWQRWKSGTGSRYHRSAKPEMEVKIKYSDKSESLGKYKIRIESSSGTPLDRIDLKLRVC